MTLEIFETKPNDFDSSMQVSACYIEVDNRFLILQRPANRLQEPNRWGVPGGKHEIDETPLQAARRELFEETTIEVDQTLFNYLGKLFARDPDVDFVYHLFQVQLDNMPQISISNEHQDYAWASRGDLQELPLMAGFQEALEYYFRRNCLTADRLKNLD